MLSKLTDEALKQQNYEDKILNLLYNDSTYDKNIINKSNKSYLNTNNNNIPNSSVIKVDKSLRKFIEPTFKLGEFSKLPQKFHYKTSSNAPSNSINDTKSNTRNQENETNSLNISSLLNNSSFLNSSKIFDHRLTTSEVEFIKTDEKLTMTRMNEIINKNKSSVRCSINDNICQSLKTDTFTVDLDNFHYQFLVEEEKCYEEMSKDLKSNGLNNLEYKSKLAATYLNIMMNEENKVKFIYKDLDTYKDINEFLNEETCVFLCILFINDFPGLSSLNKNNNNEIIDLKTLINYCHLNFLFLIMDIINKSNISEDANNKLFNDLKKNLNYLNYEKCKTLLELNMEGVGVNKYKNNFRMQNKIIKCVLMNLLSSLSEMNKTVADYILRTLNSKDKSFLQLITDLNENLTIKEKMKRIFSETKNPETFGIVKRPRKSTCVRNSDSDENNVYSLSGNHIIKESNIETKDGQGTDSENNLIDELLNIKTYCNDNKTVDDNCSNKNSYQSQTNNSKCNNSITYATNTNNTNNNNALSSNNNKSNENFDGNIQNKQKQSTESEDYDPDDYYNLPKPNPPFLPPKDPQDKREYVLVLDLDETLVHYFEDENEETAYVKVRMNTEDFITKLSEYCEIVIFTASTQYYADIVIDGLDCKDKIDYKLYRQHTNLVDGVNIKDLSLLGRPLEKIIIIDNIEENYQSQPRNGLNISDFEGDEKDNELDFLLKDLLKIVTLKGIDVRLFLNDVRRNMSKRYTNFN